MLKQGLSWLTDTLINRPHLCESISGLSVQFHWSLFNFTHRFRGRRFRGTTSSSTQNFLTRGHRKSGAALGAASEHELPSQNLLTRGHRKPGAALVAASEHELPSHDPPLPHPEHTWAHTETSVGSKLQAGFRRNCASLGRSYEWLQYSSLWFLN